ncbi:hypothetical protein BLNAU_17425 [Blattamonas nauphoetae]|uniref:Uncharacterized protein n=1 Tax=Blattamonas nauphoetae TaxID=2049346 RepID=A0ABQ9X8V6_9EUKA|nr:hypothetical protein BLNAU_17425 [Blattamonas nauphoetae]
MLAKVQYPLDETLQNKIVIFQNTLRPYWNRQEDGETQLKDPILNEDRTYTGAIDSLVKLMSFPYPNIVEAALSFSTGIFYQLFPSSQSRLVEDGFVPLIFSSREAPWNRHFVSVLGHYVVVPSIANLRFLHHDRHVLRGDQFAAFVILLCNILQIGLSLIMTREVLLSTRLLPTISLVFSSLDADDVSWFYLDKLNSSLDSIVTHGIVPAISLQSLFEPLNTEGFEDLI